MYRHTEYTRNASNLITGILIFDSAESIVPMYSINYTYDANDRITQCVISGANITTKKYNYIYDENGNITDIVFDGNYIHNGGD